MAGMTFTLGEILDLVGRLDDAFGDDTARERFRRRLTQSVTEVGQLQDYIEECLRTPGEQYSRALQDLVNHVGQFLGFGVTYGRYQGVQGQIGFDGHWESPTGFHIVVEVKTTETYPIKTPTLVGYIDGLISEQHIPNWDNALGLYVVGRPDPGFRQLENSIIAERRSAQLRVVSVDSLLTLADFMAEHDVSHDDVLTLIRPSGPSIDPVVSLLSGLVAEPSSARVAEPTASGGGYSAAASQSATNPTPAGANLPPASAETAYWLTPVKSDKEATAESVVETLVGHEQVYGFGENTPGRKKIKPGDWICFYASRKGVVAHARVASFPENRPHAKVHHPERFPWTFQLEQATVYAGKPVVLDPALRAQLHAYQGKGVGASWSWFVQGTHTLSQHDFELLTRPGSENSVRI